MSDRGRAQSETVGVILLTAVVVILATVIGAFLISNFDRNNEKSPIVDIESDIHGGDLLIEHRGGESYETGDISVVLRGDFEEKRWRLNDNDFEHERGTNPEQFSPGDRWRNEDVSDLMGEVELLVIDERGGVVLHTRKFTVGVK